MGSKMVGSDVGPLYVSANIPSLINPPINDRRADCFDIILSQTFFLCIVKSPVQKSGAGVRLIRRSMSGSVQLKNLGLKSLTIEVYFLPAVPL